MRYTSPIASVCCGVALLIGSFAVAQTELPARPELLAETDLLEEHGGSAPDFENRYRIGIDCEPASEALQRHLNLAEGQGLLVNFVVDDSSAGRAGVERLDIIVEANGKSVGTVMDLVRVVNEVGPQELQLRVMRAGNPTTLTVTPEQRDESEIEQLRNGFRRRMGRQPLGLQGMDDLPPELRQQLERFERLMPGMDDMGSGFGFRRVLPGIMLDELPPPGLPNGTNLEMKVEKSGDGPARITIRRGNESWDVTEDDLNQLPDDIRPLVENMLNKPNRTFQGLVAPGRARNLRPRQPAQPRSPNLNKRFDGLQLQLEQLQDAIRRIEDGNQE